MTDRTNHCTGCKERQDRIEALQAEVERLSARTYADGVEDGREQAAKVAGNWTSDNNAWSTSASHTGYSIATAIRAMKGDTHDPAR